MKKILLILLLFPLLGFTQMLNLPVSRVLNIKGSSIATYNNSNGIFVPEGKVWQYIAVTGETLEYFSNGNLISRSYPLLTRISVTPISGGTVEYLDVRMNKYFVIPAGVNFRITNDMHDNEVISIIEYDLNSQGLSYNTPQKTTPTLYPNPTSSLLALNSDKEYDIEVYDMAGNKVMALTGNNINMAHLSTATYIVKATDKSNNEELTYKVVKN
ncbi:MAG: T9SS type A sorting domain-containing protein [Flavobacteriaceae bacterium]|nr:T9SS type A sorting domain-containing protein [Flavobacteriaceae bacterium]